MQKLGSYCPQKQEQGKQRKANQSSILKFGKDNVDQWIFFCLESPHYHNEALFLQCLKEDPKESPGKGCSGMRKLAGLWRGLIAISHQIIKRDMTPSLPDTNSQLTFLNLLFLSPPTPRRVIKAFLTIRFGNNRMMLEGNSWKNLNSSTYCVSRGNTQVSQRWFLVYSGNKIVSPQNGFEDMMVQSKLQNIIE